eukprot:2339009-Amphidinium_carterae.2
MPGWTPGAEQGSWKGKPNLRGRQALLPLRAEPSPRFHGADGWELVCSSSASWPQTNSWQYGCLCA